MSDSPLRSSGSSQQVTRPRKLRLRIVAVPHLACVHPDLAEQAGAFPVVVVANVRRLDPVADGPALGDGALGDLAAAGVEQMQACHRSARLCRPGARRRHRRPVTPARGAPRPHPQLVLGVRGQRPDQHARVRGPPGLERAAVFIGRPVLHLVGRTGGLRPVHLQQPRRARGRARVHKPLPRYRQRVGPRRDAVLGRHSYLDDVLAHLQDHTSGAPYHVEITFSIVSSSTSRNSILDQASRPAAIGTGVVV